MIGNGPFNVFRKPHTVYIVGDSGYDRGVVVPGPRLTTQAFFSVQSIRNTQEIEAFPEGRRVSDWRRLYSDTRLPLPGDEMFYGGDLTADDADLETDTGMLIKVGMFIGERGGLGNPAIVVIDGHEYEVKHREPWQNGIISHYKYYVVRKSYG